MDQNDLARLIKRVKSGTATPQEIEKAENIWNNAKEDTAFLKEHTSQELDGIGENMYWAVKQSIAKHRQPYFSRFTNQVFYRAAAAVLILLTVSLWWYHNSNEFIEMRTGYGERLTVTLPDHSSVILNGNSVLRYAKQWNERSIREVWIEGEGFFSVTHTENHQKFIVHASDQVNVEVLGTKFNVKSRKDVSEVMLTEGKVKLGIIANADISDVHMKPGELATINDRRFSKRTVQQKKYTSWIENKLTFERTSLNEVGEILKETYGLEVTFENPELASRELSGEISSATIDEILYAIGETFNLAVEKNGKSVRISLPQSNPK